MVLTRFRRITTSDAGIPVLGHAATLYALAGQLAFGERTAGIARASKIEHLAANTSHTILFLAFRVYRCRTGHTNFKTAASIASAASQTGFASGAGCVNIVHLDTFVVVFVTLPVLAQQN